MVSTLPKQTENSLPVIVNHNDFDQIEWANAADIFNTLPVPAAEPVKKDVVRGRPVLCEMAPWDCVHIWKQAEDAPSAVVNHHGYDRGLAWPVVD